MSRLATSKNRPKVLIVGAFPPPGSTIVGGQLRACETLMASSFGDEFDFILIDSTQASNPQPHLVWRTVLAGKRFLKFLQKLALGRPDAVMLFAPVGAGLLEKGVMARISKLLGAPAVLFPLGAGIIDTYHTSRWQRIWIGWVFRGSSVNCCQGKAWQDFFVKDLGQSPSRSPIIGNWTATPDLIAIGASRQAAEPGVTLRLLFLGWLEREKGIFELLEACSRIKHHTRFHLIVAGGGHAEPAARRFVEEHGLTSNITFVGWIRGDDLLQLFSQSDVLVLPSWAEGFPMAVVEAMAAGLAILTTAVGVIPDTLTHQREALIVPPRDSVALAEALEILISDEQTRFLLQRHGFDFALKHFTPEIAATKLSALIRGLIHSTD